MALFPGRGMAQDPIQPRKSAAIWSAIGDLVEDSEKLCSASTGDSVFSAIQIGHSLKIITLNDPGLSQLRSL